MNCNELGIYIHIPFCKQKCYYCDFISYAGKEEKAKAYVQALIKEIQSYNLNKYNVTTIYIGGGTPSNIDSKYILEILEELKQKLTKNETNFSDIEITLEINPGTVTKQKMQEYKNAGVNRLSIGLQSTNNKLLKQIGRIHTYEEFLKTYKEAEEVGFNNINIDLMLGIPNQTISDLRTSLNNIIKLKPNHISVYSLIVEENTKIEKMIEDGVFKLPSEELERQMYWYVKNTLELNGYNHYEISNFSYPNKESLHNSKYWENKQYKYPTSLLEVERNPQASMDWFYPTKDSEPADGIVLQDSLNAFYNNATNFFPMYFETGKVTNANIQTYGGTDKMTYGIGLGYYDEAGILKGTGFNRIDLTTNISVTPIERLDVDLRFYISLTNRKKSSENQTDGFQTSTNVEVVPGDPYELTTLLPGEGSVVWDEVLKSQQGIKEKNRSIRGRANVKIGYDIIDGLNISTSLAADYSLHRRHYFSPSYLDEDGFSISVGETGINLMALNETMLSFQKMLKEHHSFNF